MYPAPEAAHVPLPECPKQSALKPDPNGFGRWTCQSLPKAPNAEELAAGGHLRNGAFGIAQTKQLKGQNLVDLLWQIGREFAKAGREYGYAGDDENRRAAEREASRFAVMAFIESSEIPNSEPPEDCMGVNVDVDNLDPKKSANG